MNQVTIPPDDDVQEEIIRLFHLGNLYQCLHPGDVIERKNIQVLRCHTDGHSILFHGVIDEMDHPSLEFQGKFSLMGMFMVF